MNRLLSFIVLAPLLFGCSRTDNPPAFFQQSGTSFSPKLARFLLDHPAASTILSNVISEVSSGRAVQIYYFYTDDESVPKAHHHFIGDSSVVGIFVRENQQPCDECISILFELLNSKGEKRFRELWGQAKSGLISKQDFVREIQRQEFQAVKSTQDLLRNFKLNQKEIAQSQSYDTFINSPSDFEKFQAHSLISSRGQDQRNYEQLYDKIRNPPQPQETQPQP